ncbi:glycoside hydrolase family 3 C-terminal domain-containing protein [Nonomuraea roseola]|uniref:Glycoside hydrolase family 3 C-terminal domain-containing protein n=1 Tax=Nonomuraea roseola TaxID=46179 RepID=A0ABV5PXD8_9ACTN
MNDLTLAEKAALTSGASLWTTKPVERAGIASITLSDGPHGVRRQLTGGDHLGIGRSIPATCMPPAVALGSSWDPDLLRGVGAALGAEARALGVQVLLGPGINIKRSPLCGRNFEYLSEDPLVSGVLGAALVEGVQSSGVGAALKHFAANNQETNRLRVSAEVDERTLREIYLAAFEHVVKRARPWTVMCAYNKVNGEYASQNRWLLTTVLREEWGFDGLVMSDWGAVDDRVAGVWAGLDLEMPTSGGITDALLVEAVRVGRLDPALLDLAVSRVLALVAKARAAQPEAFVVKASAAQPEAFVSESSAAQSEAFVASAPDARPGAVMVTEGGGAVEIDGVRACAHHRLARQVAAQCAVLLKNDGVLPLATSTSVAVLGELARTPRYQGAGSSQIVPTRLDDALTEMRALAGADLPFAPGYRLDHGEPDEALVEQAREVAAAAQVAVVFLGLPEGEESEGYDRAHLDLPAGQSAMLDAVIATGTRTVVVLSNGGVVAVSGWDARVAAILEGWLLGQAGGGAVADLLYGVANPSGRLAETIPLRLEDTPSFLNFPGDPDQVRYGEGVFVGYRYHDAVRGEVGYPFGHGLSYTAFVYSDLTVSVKGADEEIEVEVAARVTNTGGRQGREVAQLYVSAPSATVRRPVRELRGFTKVALEPGESAVVRFALGYRDFSYFDVREGRWAAEPGTASVHVGASSRDLRLHAEVTLDVAGRRPPLTPDSPLGDWFADDAGRTALLGVAREPSRFLSEEYARTLGSIPLSRLARFPGSKIDPDSLDELAARVRDDRP